jgi:serine/threonine protein kinase
MAPEIVLGRGRDKSCDFWSLGILVYELLCSVTPFEGQTQQETFEHIVYSQRYLRFPIGFDPHAKSLIRKLLTNNFALRLGALR